MAAGGDGIGDWRSEQSWLQSGGSHAYNAANSKYERFARMKFNYPLITHQLPALLLAVTIFTSLGTTPALAAASEHPFQDVAKDASYAAAVQYVYDNGISCGTGATTFSPNNLITYGELSLMLCRMYWPDESWSIESATDYVRERMGYVINPAEAQYSKVTNATAYEAILSCSGDPVYSQTLYEPDVDEEDQIDDGIYTAIRLGLCDEADTERRMITRSEAVQILYKASQTNLELEAPPIVDKLNVKVDENYNGKCAPYLEAAAELPEVILDRFEDKGWTLVIGSEFIDQWSTENNSMAVGLTSYTNKSIYVRSSGSVTHEFGHFLHSELGRPLIVGDLFEKEAEQAKPVIGDYAMTNKSEYFAEFFERWINWDDAKLQRLQEVAPETYAYFAELEEQGWLPES